MIVMFDVYRESKLLLPMMALDNFALFREFTPFPDKKVNL